MFLSAAKQGGAVLNSAVLNSNKVIVQKEKPSDIKQMEFFTVLHAGGTIFIGEEPGRSVGEPAYGEPACFFQRAFFSLSNSSRMSPKRNSRPKSSNPLAIFG